MKRLLLIFFSSVAVVILCTLPVLALISQITTLPATNIGYTTATLNARAAIPIPGINHNGNNIIFVDGFYEGVYFKYGTSPGNLTNQTPPSDVTGGMVMAKVTGLRTGTTYYAEAVLTHPALESNRPGPMGYLMTLFSTASQCRDMHGAGVGLNAVSVFPSPLLFGNIPDGETEVGNIISFTTLTPTGQSGSSSTMGTTTQTGEISNIVVQTAAISTSRVSPGEKVNITATLVNRGNHDGTAKVTLYVNGTEEQSKGVNLSSGQTMPTSFTVMRDEPGTYNVYVNNVAAGSFTVDIFNNNDGLIYGMIALITLAIIAVLYFLVKKPARSG